MSSTPPPWRGTGAEGERRATDGAAGVDGGVGGEVAAPPGDTVGGALAERSCAVPPGWKDGTPIRFR
jgi:hypothetical protein